MGRKKYLTDAQFVQMVSTKPNALEVSKATGYTVGYVDGKIRNLRKEGHTVEYGKSQAQMDTEMWEDESARIEQEFHDYMNELVADPEASTTITNDVRVVAAILDAMCDDDELPPDADPVALAEFEDEWEKWIETEEAAVAHADALLMNEGWDMGHDRGYDSGYDIGHDSGYKAGYDNGCYDGHRKGYKEAAKKYFKEGAAHGEIMAALENESTYDRLIAMLPKFDYAFAPVVQVEWLQTWIRAVELAGEMGI